MYIIVDDEELALKLISDAIKTIEYEAQILTYKSPSAALEYLKKGNNAKVSAAFLDINIGEMNGIELAKHIRKLAPNCNIVFTTGYNQYYGEAFELGASDYLLKPITPDKVKRALNNFRVPKESLYPEKLYIQCFGNFEIFYDKTPIKFQRQKTKEMLAYLVLKKGSGVTKREMTGILFDIDNSSYYGVCKKDLIDTLKNFGCEELIITSWKSMAINMKYAKCDFYDYEKGLPRAINLYKGDFMSQYEWAEDTNAILYNRTI